MRPYQHHELPELENKSTELAWLHCLNAAALLVTHFEDRAVFMISNEEDAESLSEKTCQLADRLYAQYCDRAGITYVRKFYPAGAKDVASK